MTPEKLARDIALEGKQRMPLRNAQPGLRWVRNGIRFGEGTRPAGERIRERCRRAGSEIGDRGRCNHRIDQAQCAGKPARNRGLQGEELAIDRGERNTIARTHRTVHLAREESQSTASRPRRASATRRETGAKKLENPAIALVGLGDERRISAERPIDEEINVLCFEAAEIVMNLGRSRRGERLGSEAPCLVIEQPGRWLGNPLVGERDHQGRSALGSRDDTGSHPHPSGAPALQGREIVVEREREAAARSDDDLDPAVEVAVDHQVDDVDQISGCGPGQLVVKKYDRMVGVGAECGHGVSSLHRSAEEPRARQTADVCGKMKWAAFGGFSRVSSRGGRLVQQLPRSAQAVVATGITPTVAVAIPPRSRLPWPSAPARHSDHGGRNETRAHQR